MAGLNSAIVPVYMKEFSPHELAGKTGVLVGLVQKFGLSIYYMFRIKTKYLNSDFIYFRDTFTFKTRFITRIKIY